MEGGSFAEALASIGRAFASPAKIAFIGYVLLAYAGKIQTNIYQFAFATGLFVCLQVFHDDYLRIVLNRKAEGYRERRTSV
jgi:hypothetical protein